MFKAIVIPGLCAFSALAQTAPPPKDLLFQKQVMNLAVENSFGPISITAALAGPMSTIPGAPYSAQAVTQRVQILADGNRITQTTTNAVARDSQGRVRREESLPFPGLGNGAAEPPRLVLIEDPVAGMHITLDSNTKTAIKAASGQMKKADEVAARNGLPAIGPDTVWFDSAGPGPQLQVATKMKLDEEGKTATTDLGTQTIEGVAAKGTKTTRTIPAGEMGNDLPIVITTEIWRSPELKVLVMSKSTDPRMGETTYKLTNISRGEPDPALFQIPADYTIKDQPGNAFFFRTADKADK